MFDTLNRDGSFDLDFTGVEEERIVPEGVYPVRVIEAEIKNSERSGKPAMYLKLELLGPDKYVGRSLFYIVSLQPQARGIVQTALIGLGYDREDLKGPVRLNPASLLERIAGARVITQTYEGNLQNRVSALVPIDRVPAEAMGAPESPFAASDDAKDKADVF